MTQRRQLSEQTTERLSRLRAERDTAAAAYKAQCVQALSEASIREVMRVTGLSMSTLQNWRRELE